MITINLKPGARRAAPKTRSFAGTGAWFSSLSQGLRQPGLALALGSWAIVLAVLGVLYLRNSMKMNTLAPELEKTQNEYRRFRNYENDKHREVRVRDSLLAQIGTIAAVDQDRYVWSHILDEVASAVPDFTWLTDLSAIPAVVSDDSTAAPVSLRIVGLTNDLQNYTAFLRRLAASPWLTNVQALEAKTVIERGTERPLTQFTVQASFLRADSTRIRTVPIIDATARTP